VPVCTRRALSFVPHDGPNSLASCAALLRCLRRRRPCTWRRSFATSTAHRKPVRSHGSSPSPRRGMLFSRHRPRALSGESRRVASNCRPGSRSAVPPFRVVSASGPDGDPHCALYARVRGGRGNRPPELPGLRRPYPGCLRGHDGAFTERSCATVPRLSASIVVSPCGLAPESFTRGPDVGDVRATIGRSDRESSHRPSTVSARNLPVASRNFTDPRVSAGERALGAPRVALSGTMNLSTSALPPR
jgi:hypothetical protein